MKQIIQKFKKTSIDTGNYSSIAHNSDTLYSNEFLTQLKNSLGSFQNFIKSNKSQRVIIQERVDILFALENHYKYFHTKNKLNQQPLLKILDKEYSSFSDKYITAFAQNSYKKNVNKKFFRNKLIEFLKNLFENQTNILQNLDVKEKELLKTISFENIISDIDTKEIFILLCTCAVSSAYNQILWGNFNPHFNIDTDIELNKDYYLEVKRHDLKIDFVEKFLFLLISKVVECLYKTLKQSDDLHLKINLDEKYITLKMICIITSIKKNKPLKETFPQFELLESACESILDIFVATVPISVYTITKETSNSKIATPKILVLPTNIVNLHCFSDHFPRLIEPAKWNLDGVINNKFLVKSMHMGLASPNFDPETINAINITQNKKFKINTNFLNLLETFNNAPINETEGLNLPFSTKAELIELENKVNFLKDTLDIPTFKKKLIEVCLLKEVEIRSYLKKEFNISKIWVYIIKGLNRSQIIKLTILKKELYKLKIFNLKKRIFNSMVDCA